MRYTTKTSILILLAGAFLFVVVQTQDDPVSNTTTKSCGFHEVPTACSPCDHKCIGGTTVCALVCAQNPIFCRCADNYSRISSSNKKCVPTKKCYLYNGTNSATTDPLIK